MSELDFKALELKVNQLIEVCKGLQLQNQALQKDNDTWRTERAKVMQQKDLARTKVEAMISRLKALEH